MTEINIVGDVHGCYNDLMALVQIMPKAPFLSVGDMIDRGPLSLDVLRFFMEPGNTAVLGNHEHMMIDYYYNRRRYEKGIWLDYRNGGYQTLKSFNPELIMAWEFNLSQQGKIANVDEVLKLLKKHKQNLFPKDVMKWLDKRPLYYRQKGLLVTHAPRDPDCPWKRLLESKEDPLMKLKMSSNTCSLLWNCSVPHRIKDVFQVHGHVITPTVFTYKDCLGKLFGCSIDTHRGHGTKLTGIHWPSLQVYSIRSGETGTTMNLF